MITLIALIHDMSVSTSIVQHMRSPKIQIKQKI